MVSAAPFFLLCLLALPAAALDLSDLGAAEADLESLVTDWQAEWKAKSDAASARELGVSLQALGVVERQAGKPEEALYHLSAAYDLLAIHAPEMVADALEAKALTLQDLGRLTDSEKDLRAVLTFRQKNPPGLKLAATLDHLALNLLYQARYPEVAPLFDQAEAALPAGDLVFRAKLVSHRGRLHHTLGSHARAAAAFAAALEIPFDDPELRLALRSQLALAQLRLGKTEEARAGTEAAADEARRLFLTTPARAIPYLNNLGAMALSQNEPEEAAAAFEEALEMTVKSSGPDHPSLCGLLNNLGVAEQALGDFEKARAHLERAESLQAKWFPPTHLRVAETERNLARNSLLSGSPDARDRVVKATRTGMNLLDKLIREGTERERLNFLERFDLVSLPCAIGDAELIADVLLASKARLLDAMLGSSGNRPSWREVQASLPAGSAFIDTCRFTTTDTPSIRRYGAVVILPAGPPKWVPLGSDEGLKRWLGAYNQRLRWRFSGKSSPPPPLKMKGILRALDREFWEPLGLPEETRHIAFSPDSRLHFLPLPALLDSENRPLSSRHLQVTTVTSGRDLLNPLPTQTLAGSPWEVLTISDFPKSPEPPDGNKLLNLLAGLEPMPGTKAEAKKLRALAPDDSKFLSGPDAAEKTLLTLKTAPSVLHLGCHAFFLEGNDAPPAMPVDFDERPELLSAGGLVLYRGAERRADSAPVSPDDDLLFPAEIARLPLKGTRLVTLSSCDSGAGTPVSGEGILGLRRSFSLAGAREILVALWPVADSSTPDFMEKFYRLALASDRPAQALWQAQGEFLNAAGNDDDYELAVVRYAPFSLSQNSPLLTGPVISAPDRSMLAHWRYLLGGIPLILFLAARWSSSGRKSKPL
jgi:CHAT domain-containing protein/tetratricopeptide (TPR) repeat protein